jgi:pimeloyl-ACP methyl ester carboxylesterase
MGAMTAIRFAAGDSRVRRLVLGGIGGDPKEWGTPAALAKRAERSERILSGLTVDDVAEITDPLALRVRKLMEARGNDLAAMAAIQRAHRPMGGDVDVTAVTAPTLVVCGEDDFAPQPLAAALPDGMSQLLPGDHEGVVSDPQLAKVIVAFLDERALVK